MSHVCGLCLALRKTSGPVARLTTNYDAALLSVLYEALVPDKVRKVQHYCPLRQFQPAAVVSSDNPGARFAASIALSSAATKIEDHVVDQESVVAYFPRLFGWLAASWKELARKVAQSLGFSTAVIDEETRHQPEVEAQPGRDFFFYSQPTEAAVGAACSHVAVLAGQPEKVGILDQIGRLFGRIMYLLDAYKDFEDDRKKGKFNPLAACFGQTEISQQSRGLFRQAHGQIKEHFDQLKLSNPGLARRLLIDQLEQVGKDALGNDETQGDNDEESSEKKLKRPVVKVRRRSKSASPGCQPIVCCDPGCADCFGHMLCFGCDLNCPDFHDAGGCGEGCADSCNVLDGCSGCDCSCG